VADRLSKLPA